MAISNSDRTTYFFNPIASSLIDFQIKNQHVPDENLRHSVADKIFTFCQECKHYCKRRGVRLRTCQNFRCFCLIQMIGD